MRRKSVENYGAAAIQRRNALNSTMSMISSDKYAEFKISKKPHFFNDPKLTQNIQFGSTVFGKPQNIQKSSTNPNAFTALLGKILESNLTVRQIKNGQTLFKKEVMQKKYNNPYLEVEKMKEELNMFIEKTKPKTEMELIEQE